MEKGSGYYLIESTLYIVFYKLLKPNETIEQNTHEKPRSLLLQKCLIILAQCRRRQSKPTWKQSHWKRFPTRLIHQTSHLHSITCFD